MATRTVRLDDDSERELARLRKLTGLPISELLKRGLMTYRNVALKEADREPYEIFSRLDLGEGGYARAPADRSKSAVTDIIRRKHAR